MFSGCIALSSLSLNVETIGKETFYNLSSLSDVDLGENVKTIGESAFGGCKSLKEIVIPDATLSLGESAFSGCQSLQSVTFGNALTSIGQRAFSSCGSLAQLSIPETVVSIGDYAFSYCSNLSDINIPENIETIGTYTFEDCTSLSEIKLPESIETIPAGMFANCSSLSSIDIPIGVTEIGENAFSGCEKLTILDLSENTSLLSIGGNAFYGCLSIEIINFPTTLESIGINAFSDCTALSLMSIPSVTPPSLPSTLADFSFNNLDNILCAISIPTDSFWDYYDTNSWTRFMDGDETTGKEQIDITVENPVTESGDGSDSTVDDTMHDDCCHIHYHKGHIGPKHIRAVMRTNEETGEETQTVNSAKTYGGSSVFIAENENVSFVITPTEGYKVESVYYDTDADGVEEDVTSQFVDNVYTTPAAESLAIKSLRIKLAEDTPTSVEKVNDSITNNVKVIGNTIQVPEGAVIFNIDGLKVDGNNLSSGIYIVSYRNQRMKVLVK